MSYRLHVDVIGAKELQAAFRKAPELIERELGGALTRSAYRAEGLAKGKAPVDTAALRSSIQTQAAKREGFNLIARVATSIKHAIFQERGTGIYGPSRQMIRPRKGKLLAWRKDGRWHFARQVRGTKPKWYMRDARDGVRGYLFDEMKGGLRAITRALAH